MRLFIITALMTFFVSEAKAIMNKGDVVYPRLLCEKDAIFMLAKEDEKSMKRAEAMAVFLVSEGKCIAPPGPIGMKLENLAHVYTSSWDKRITEIWQIEGSELYILFIDPRKKSNSI